jgi:hypothetical protein
MQGFTLTNIISWSLIPAASFGVSHHSATGSRETPCIRAVPAVVSCVSPSGLQLRINRGIIIRTLLLQF